MLGVINVPTSIGTTGRMIGMKNAIYLTPFEDELDSLERMEVEHFARKYDLRLVGESHYPFIVPILNPHDFVNILSDMNADTFICDDKCLIYADIYNDGEITNSIKKKGITVFHKKLNCELEAICSVMSEEMKNSIKHAVSNSLQELNQESIGQIAVLTNNTEREEFSRYIEMLSEKFETKVPTICMNDYYDEMKPVLENYIKSNNIEKIVIYDEEMMIPEFIEVMNQLSVNIESRKEFDLEMNEEPINAMKLN